jgi:hypothetical protein
MESLIGAAVLRRAVASRRADDGGRGLFGWILRRSVWRERVETELCIGIVESDEELMEDVDADEAIGVEI